MLGFIAILYLVQVFREWDMKDFVAALPPPVLSIQKLPIPIMFVYTESDNEFKLRQQRKNDKRASENKNESNVDKEDANNEQEEEENETSRDNDEDKDEDVSCEIAAGGNTDTPSINICEDVLMMVKTAELRAKIEREGDY